MAKTKEKKGFNAGVYAVVSGVVVAVVLVALTIFAFTTRYTAFSPEKVAVAYTDGIVQTADGYNAYKQTLVSKNQKFGDFVINAYMTPYINDGDDVKQNEVIGSGSDEEAKLLDEVYNTMYDYYVATITEYGFDDYDAVFSNYFAKLKEVRKDVIGDDYMSTDFMFSVFEANVTSYGESLTGTEEELAKDNKTVLREATVGVYQEMFGKDYKFTTTVADSKEIDAKAYVAEYAKRIASVVDSAEAKATEFGLKDEAKDKFLGAYENLDCTDDITAVQEVTLNIRTNAGDDKLFTEQKVYVVRIGNSWYVDQTNVDTNALYFAL